MPPPAPPPHRTATAEQAALLLDVELRALLSLLMHTPSTAGEVAAHLGLELGRAHYRLTRLARAGVAEVTTHPRAGRALKRYRVAGRWFIPYEVTGAETRAAFVEAQIMPRMERFVGLGIEQLGAAFEHWGYWLEQAGPSTTLHMGDLDREAEDLFEGDEPFLLNIGTLRLTRRQAGELKRRLLAVVNDFGVPSEGQPYTLGLLLPRGEVV